MGSPALWQAKTVEARTALAPLPRLRGRLGGGSYARMSQLRPLPALPRKRGRARESVEPALPLPRAGRGEKNSPPRRDHLDGRDGGIRPIDAELDPVAAIETVEQPDRLDRVAHLHRRHEAL